MLRRITLTTVFCLATALVSQSQQPAALWKSRTGRQYETFNFQTNIGSFRFVGTQTNDGKPRVRAEGTVEISFSGTVLINDLDGTVVTSGNVRREYEGNNRQAYFGTGKLVVRGEFWAIQFFGSKLSGRWNGWGLARLYGEFDENLNTGTYWFNNETRRDFWNPFGTTLNIPRPKNYQGVPVAPRERPKTGG